MDFFPKRPAAVPGIVLRMVLGGIGIWLFAYLLVGAPMASKVGLLSVLGVLTPGILLTIAHQIWLRRRVARSQQTKLK